MKRALAARRDESTYERRPHLVVSFEDQCLELTPRTVAKQVHELVALRQRVSALEGMLANTALPNMLPPAKTLPPLLDQQAGMTENASLTKLPTVRDGFMDLARHATAPALLPMQAITARRQQPGPHATALPINANTVTSPAKPTKPNPTSFGPALQLGLLSNTLDDPTESSTTATKFIVDHDGSLVVAVSKRSRLYTIIQHITNRATFKDEQIFRLKKMVDAEFGDVISVLESVADEDDVAVVEQKILHLLHTGSPSKWFMHGSPPQFKVDDIPYPLTKIAHNLSTLATHQEVVVLVSSGAYNPVHMLHIRAFYAARQVWLVCDCYKPTTWSPQHIEANYKFPVVGGIISPSHDTYVRTKNRRKPREMIPKTHRLAMLEAATASSSWIEVDKWEITRRRVLDYLSTLTHVREICEHQFPQFKFRVLYVCGVNTIVKLSHTALKDEGFGCTIICRPNQTDMLHKHLGAKWSKIAIVVEDVGVLACELERATSFRVRQALIQGESCSAMVGKNVHEYMVRHRIADKIAGREPWTAEDRLWRAQDLPYVEYSEMEIQSRADVPPLDC
ncbi:Aste57867_11042 [Aphanomyces stellatus]|uniref:Aste57867_11042 protein n=1 Tax=Aphanomyces stellatus TaxID=120398 RepID=A0A485KS16_9STRA|nr:hypothetical protein As57867_011000 [Aphanomyces stellatus]VFT87910.1 Aste57867_11042 [Aphanomyces stellatus]